MKRRELLSMAAGVPLLGQQSHPGKPEHDDPPSLARRVTVLERQMVFVLAALREAECQRAILAVQSLFQGGA